MTDRQTLLKRIAVAIIAVVILAYTVFHMISLFSGEISTVVVGASVEETKVEFRGHVFRDETVVYASYGGAVDYVAADGYKLGFGETLAVVYEQGNNYAVDRNIDEIDRRIAILEEGVKNDVTLFDLPAINDNIGDEYHQIMTKLAKGDVSEISSNIDSMMAQLCKKSMLTNEKSPVPDTLESLYAERDRLMAAGGDSVTLHADKSGYFFSGFDGYENIFTSSAASEMTLSAYHKLLEKSPETAPNGSYPIGKMVYDTRWYLISALTQEKAAYFEEGATYELTFTGGDDVTMPLKVVAKSKASGGEVLIKFECDRIPGGFDFARSQSVEAVVKRVSGISVPKAATHKSDGFLYVYILRGSVVFERRIEVIYEGSDYYVVKDGLEPEGDDVFLQSNDTVILDGKNLFDGRILD
ncbi:MAG: hypothetical protein J6V42_00300 [Clostridia bacterium]|nr:hypothetical protein [Clostridia bacterium]